MAVFVGKDLPIKRPRGLRDADQVGVRAGSGR
jgi:hypothetical protein